MDAVDKKAFFLDLDGTLLNDKKEVTPEDRAALQSALDRGHKVVIASGRPPQSVAVQASRLGLDGPGCYWIACNGAVVYDCGAGRELLHRSLAMEDLYALFDEARRRGVYIQTYGPEGVLVEASAPAAKETVERYCAGTLMHYDLISNVRREVPTAPEKALMIDFAGREKTEAMRQWIADNLSGRVDSYFSSAWYLEAVAAGVDKGNAVGEVCRILGLPIASAIAAGDEANDITMLRAAGTGFAMANAQPAVKEAADVVLDRDNNHGGVAEMIARVLG
ncbi:MAG: HAD family phosphatase [Oscillibacter sp.]|nr:HAD family phosphatase [Oscillibacter sp.]